MQLHRTLNPQWRFNDPATYLLAEIATIESERRYLEVVRMLGVDDDGRPIPVPQHWWPAKYGPPDEEHTADSADAVDDGPAARAAAADARARQVAAELRAELVA
jgi:hypothetical protein